MIEKGLRADELELQQPAAKARLLPGDDRGALEEVAEPAGAFSSRSEFVTRTPARRTRTARRRRRGAGDLPRKMAPGQWVRCHRVEVVGEEIRRSLG